LKKISYFISRSGSSSSHQCVLLPDLRGCGGSWEHAGRRCFGGRISNFKRREMFKTCAPSVRDEMWENRYFREHLMKNTY